MFGPVRRSWEIARRKELRHQSVVKMTMYGHLSETAPPLRHFLTDTRSRRLKFSIQGCDNTESSFSSQMRRGYKIAVWIESGNGLCSFADEPHHPAQRCAMGLPDERRDTFSSVHVEMNIVNSDASHGLLNTIRLVNDL